MTVNDRPTSHYTSAMTTWRYQQTSVDDHRHAGEDFHAAVNSHLAEMAAKGWELMTAMTRPSPDSYSHETFFIWKKPG